MKGGVTMENTWKVLGYVWSAPVTFVGVVYALAFNALGCYRWHGVIGDALVWTVNANKTPPWLLKRWSHGDGQTIGQVVVLNTDPLSDHGRVHVMHESEHVHQCMRLGIFQPLLYGVIYLAIKLGCESADPHIDHPFEVSARRRSGQIVDVIGALQKLKAEAHLGTKKQ